MDDVARDKQALRTLMRRQRKACAAAERGEAALLAQRAMELPVTDWRHVVVAAYAPAGSEIDPRPLTKALQQRGARIALPVVTDLNGPLIFRDAETQDHIPDLAGVPAPGPDAEELRPDIVLVPLLAFDLFGGRLGQGGGFYDRTLEALRRGGRVLAIGLAYAGQQVERLELAPHDQTLDGVLTEDGYRAAFKP